MTDNPRCTFAELVPVFVELYDPSLTRVTALIAQVRHLIRLGATSKPGVGKTHYFGCAEVRRLLVAMELAHLGVPPGNAIRLLNENDSAFFGATAPVTIIVGPRNSTITIDMPALRVVSIKHLPWMATGRRDSDRLHARLTGLPS